MYMSVYKTRQHSLLAKINHISPPRAEKGNLLLWRYIANIGDYTTVWAGGDELICYKLFGVRIKKPSCKYYIAFVRGI